MYLPLGQSLGSLHADHSLTTGIHNSQSHKECKPGYPDSVLTPGGPGQSAVALAGATASPSCADKLCRTRVDQYLLPQAAASNVAAQVRDTSGPCMFQAALDNRVPFRGRHQRSAATSTCPKRPCAYFRPARVGALRDVRVQVSRTACSPLDGAVIYAAERRLVKTHVTVGVNKPHVPARHGMMPES